MNALTQAIVLLWLSSARLFVLMLELNFVVARSPQGRRGDPVAHGLFFERLEIASSLRSSQ